METLPIGERFDPTKLELVTLYLRNKVEEGKNDFITDMDVFEDEPWLLKHVTPHPLFIEREWFYFVPTTQGGGSELKRTVPGKNGESEGGTWRSIDPTNPKKGIIDGNKAVIGYKQSFVYWKKAKENRKEYVTDWWMKEYSLCDDQLQDWVLCKIRHKLPEKKVNNMEYEQKEEGGLADEFVKMVLEEDGDVAGKQQETQIPLPQAQDSGFKATQSNNTKWWGDLMYEQFQMLPMILQAQDSRGLADQDIIGCDMMMNRTNRGLALENSGCVCVTTMKEN